MDKYKIINCKKCSQKLRIPDNKNLQITCPKCNYAFRVYSPNHKEDVHMSFVDELNQMPSKKELEMQQSAAKYNEELFGIRRAIRGSCIDNRDKKSSQGFIVRSYDDEYCVYGFEFLTSLVRDNSSKLTSPYCHDDQGTKYDASIISDKHRGDRQGLAPISIVESDCSKYINDLRAELQKDGFHIEELVTTPCYREYDILKIKSGFLSSTKTFVHNKTDKLLGYVIGFHVTW